MRVLIDTNIFLDILLKRDGLYEESSSVIRILKRNRDQIFVNVSTLKDIYYFANKAFHSKELARKYIVKLYSQITKLVSYTTDDAINAIYNDGDFEDNTIIQSAIRTTCDAILTRNTKDYINKGVPVLTPTELIRYR